jgi:predicted DNA binding CopG/RHH family protein
MNPDVNLESAYRSMFKQVEQLNTDISLYNELAQQVAPVYSQLPIEEIKPLVLQIIKKEKELKCRFSEILNNDEVLKIDSLKEDLKQMQLLLDSNHAYFTQGKYLNEQLDLLNTSANAFLNITTQYCFLVKKEALQVQFQLLNPGVLKV